MNTEMTEQERFAQETRELLNDERIRRVTEEIGRGDRQDYRHYHVLGDPSTQAARGSSIRGERLA